MQQFLIRHIAQRSTVAQAMSEHEQHLVNEQAGYWKKLQDQGVALIFRSAFEIKGAWGIGIIGTENLSKAQFIAANDPAVKAGFHTIEISPINAVLPQNLTTLHADHSANDASLMQ